MYLFQKTQCFHLNRTNLPVDIELDVAGHGHEDFAMVGIGVSLAKRGGD